jgi:transcriptional regulator with XRE-family HTH domain
LKRIELTQSVYRQFSENLISLCARHGSIADVCRKTGINRQQFSRYLTGTSLPNEDTLQKIAVFFNLPQTDLFQAGLVAKESRSDIRKAIAAVPDLPLELKNSAAALIEKSSDVSLPSATYAIFAPWAQAEGNIIRGTLVIASKKNAGLFTLHMPVDKAEGSEGLIEGIVEGFIVQDKSRVSMIGHWSEWLLSTCMLNLNVENSANQKTWYGTLSTFLPTGAPMACKIIIEHFGSQQSQNESIAANGIMAVENTQVEDRIRPAVHELAGSTSTLIGTDALRSWR